MWTNPGHAAKHRKKSRNAARRTDMPNMRMISARKWEKTLQGLKSWAWLPKFCRTFGFRRTFLQQAFCYVKHSAEPSCRTPVPQNSGEPLGAQTRLLEDWHFFLPKQETTANWQGWFCEGWLWVIWMHSALFSISPYQVFEAGISQLSPFPLSQIDGIAGFLLSVARDDALSCYIIFSLPLPGLFFWERRISPRFLA